MLQILYSVSSCFTKDSELYRIGQEQYKLHLKYRHINRTNLAEDIVLGIVLGLALINFAVIAAPRPSQYYFGRT